MTSSETKHFDSASVQLFPQENAQKLQGEWRYDARNRFEFEVPFTQETIGLSDDELWNIQFDSVLQGIRYIVTCKRCMLLLIEREILTCGRVLLLKQSVRQDNVV